LTEKFLTFNWTPQPVTMKRDRNVINKEAEKILKYKDSAEEIKHM
jgi:hypothetical protein